MKQSKLTDIVQRYRVFEKFKKTSILTLVSQYENVIDVKKNRHVFMINSHRFNINTMQKNDTNSLEKQYIIFHNKNPLDIKFRKFKTILKQKHYIIGPCSFGILE